MDFQIVRIFLLCLFFSFAAHAEEGADAFEVTYSLKSLKPAQLSQYRTSGRGDRREYLKFKNASGNHIFIYSESTTAPPLAEMKQLQDVIRTGQSACNVDLACRKNAFCTGKCKNLYYEVGNTPPDPTRITYNYCKLQNLKCSKE